MTACRPALLLLLAAAPAAAQPVPLPVIGCPAEGMGGPVAAPSPLPRPPPVPPRVAARLAFYAAPGMAVLAPRGWHCLETYGSGGAALLVTPDPRPNPGPILGPAVSLSYLNGWTSGRFAVARVLARLFPSRHRFVRAVIAEHLEPPSAFPSGPFPSDRIERRTRSEVAYTTAPGQAGMGTVASGFIPDAAPIQGRATLAAQDGVTLLYVRLPIRLRALVPTILRAQR